MHRRAVVRAFVLALAVGCGVSCSRPDEDSLVVFGAASLEDVLTEAGREWSQSTGIAVRFSFAGSNELARQVLAGARADLFFSAGEAEVARLLSAHLADAAQVSRFLSNRMVLAARNDFVETRSAIGADGQHASLAIAESAVPAGRYGREWLEARGRWAAFGGERNVISTLDVRAALAAVESGAVDYACVYRSDARISHSVVVVEEQGPGEPPAISYPLVLLSESRQPARARALAEFLADQSALFARHGFTIER